MTNENLMKREAPTIALDYDGTATTSIPFWTAFIHTARASGYKVIMVTMRTPQEAEEIDEHILATGIQVIATSRKGKRHFCSKLGIHPTIWIDDSPEFVLLDALPVEQE